MVGTEANTKAVSDKIKKYASEKCSYETRLENILTRHVMAVHEKVRPHRCDKCPYAAAQKENLKNT